MSSITVIYRGVKFEVEYDYQPEEKQVRYDSNMEGYPGCPASIEINGINCGEVDFTEFFTQYGEPVKITEVLNEFEKLVFQAMAEEEGEY